MSSFNLYHPCFRHLSQLRLAGRVDDALYYLLNDHLGSSTIVSDENGDAVGHVLYDPFGAVVESTLPPDLIDRLFTGQRYDAELGLYDYARPADGSRFYDPHLGQFSHLAV